MPDLRTVEISYTKNGERKSFIKQTASFRDDDEWRFVAERFQIPLKDRQNDEESHTWKIVCVGAGYTDVTFVEHP